MKAVQHVQALVKVGCTFPDPPRAVSVHHKPRALIDFVTLHQKVPEPFPEVAAARMQVVLLILQPHSLADLLPAFVYDSDRVLHPAFLAPLQFRVQSIHFHGQRAVSPLASAVAHAPSVFP